MSNNKSRLQKKYEEEVSKKLLKEFSYKNVMSIPSLTKVTVNCGLGEAKGDSKVFEEMLNDIALITGQKPVVTKAKKSISNFKVREEMDLGIKVTLRKDMMWYFIDRLISIVLPRIKDFRGIPYSSFDGRGNYSLGIKEHTVFPEVDATKVSKLRSLQVVINTTANTDEEAYSLLKELGFPFIKKNK